MVDALRASHPEGVDAVLDLVNGPDAIRRDAEILKSGGSPVSTLYAADEGWFAERQITAHNIASSANPLSSPQGLNEVARMLADGTIDQTLVSATVLISMALRAQRDEIFIRVMPALTTFLYMVDLQVGSCTAGLTPPSIALQNFGP